MTSRRGTARWLIWLHLTLLVILWLIPGYAYYDLPEIIPVHFDWHGQPDAYASKDGWSLWLLPVIGTIMGVGVMVLLRYPHTFSHPRQDDVKKLPERFRVPVYRVLQEMMLAIFVFVDIIFVVIMYGTVRVAHGTANAINWIVVLVCAIAPLGLLFFYLPRVSVTIDRMSELALTGQDPPE